jgi:L-fuconolactonase
MRVPIIDAHAHLWQRARTPQPWIDPSSMAVIDRDFWIDDLVESQSAAGIDGTVLVQSTNSTRETIDLLRLAGDVSTRVRGVVGWIDLEGDVPGQVAHLRQAPGGDRLVGIRHLAHVDPDPEWLGRPTLGFDDLAACGLTFDLVVRAYQLPAATAVVAAHPGTRFVLDHLGNPPILGGGHDDWHRDIAALAAFDNVFVKLSGILPHRGTGDGTIGDGTIDDLRSTVEAVLALFGAERVMFGTDWPLVELAADVPSWIENVRELVPAEDWDAVFGATAQRFYLESSHA